MKIAFLKITLLRSVYFEMEPMLTLSLNLSFNFKTGERSERYKGKYENPEALLTFILESLDINILQIFNVNYYLIVTKRWV